MPGIFIKSGDSQELTTEEGENEKRLLYGLRGITGSLRTSSVASLADGTLSNLLRFLVLRFCHKTTEFKQMSKDGYTGTFTIILFV